MLPSLRGPLTPREGAGRLPVLLLEIWASYPTDYLPLQVGAPRRKTSGGARGKGMHALVSEATPDHHVLRTNLRHRVGVHTVLDLPGGLAVHRRPHRDPPNPGPLGAQGARLADDPLAREVVLVRVG